MFETSIRYLAATLSAYELSGKKYPSLITKAQQVADKMSVAWVGVSRPFVCVFREVSLYYEQKNAVPFGEVDFNTSSPQIATVSEKRILFLSTV